MNNQKFICPNCKQIGQPNTKFCMNCGTELVLSVVNQPNQPQMQQSVQQAQPQMQSQVQYQQNPQMNNYEQPNQNIMKNQPKPKNGFNYFKYIINAIIKPHSNFKENENKMDLKVVLILSSIVAGIMTLFKLLLTMFNSVRIISAFSDNTTWVWENLKNIKYFKILFSSFFTYIIIIFLIASVYYIASLIVKKEIKFSKLSKIAITAFIPVGLSLSILAPILSLISSYIGLLIYIIGIVYSLIILLELINDEITFDKKDLKIYFHTICLTIVIVAIIIVFYLLLIKTLALNVSSLLG